MCTKATVVNEQSVARKALLNVAQHLILCICSLERRRNTYQLPNEVFYIMYQGKRLVYLLHTPLRS